MNTDKQYYSLARNEVFELIDKTNRPQRILEFGCGFGELGKAMKAGWNCSVTGLEINSDAEAYLPSIYDHYRITDLEDFNIAELNSTFDCFIYADVLEHLRQPDLILKNHLKYLEKGGTVIISIPNIRNFKVIADLLVKGRFDYKSSGILDKTHYKFFTRKTLIEMLTEAGLSVEFVGKNTDQFTGVKRLVAGFFYLFAPELKVCQWLIKAKKING